ncbi:MAG TPA: sugar phosphate isomerase/epimerase [Bryobacteraceae bacterium]|nr:sugar phosphate isomerase/epimerase [Bryobacteraceae bacterium]
MQISRRSWFGAMAAAALGGAEPPKLTFGFSLYGMKTFSWKDGIDHVARIGYRSTELCLRSGWDTEPKLLTKADRAEIRSRLADRGLSLASVMENVALARPGGSREDNLNRLAAAAEICYACSPGSPALIETTLGGRPDSWDASKDAMADELRAWARRVEELKVTLAIKAHSKTAVTRPERLLWLFDQAKSPHLKLVYDYSHYAAFGLDMRRTMEQVVPQAVFVHLKDTIGTAPDHHFVLPGDGPVDFRAYDRTLIELGYRGPVIVEVSVDVFGQPGYDPVRAAEHVWQKVSPAFA